MRIMTDIVIHFLKFFFNSYIHKQTDIQLDTLPDAPRLYDYVLHNSEIFPCDQKGPHSDNFKHQMAVQTAWYSTNVELMALDFYVEGKWTH